MNRGFIVLYRKMTDWEWYGDTNVKVLFLHLLLTANWETKKWRGKLVQRGELITSIGHLSEQLSTVDKFSPMQVRTALNKLKVTNEITIKTTNRFTVITINNYDTYQDINKPSNKRITNKQQTDNKRITTTKPLEPLQPLKQKNNTLGTKVPDNINSLIKLFEPINPSYKNMFKNKTQRSALERMVKEHGVVRITKLLEVLPDIVSKTYAPRITTPVQLEKKLGELQLFISQERGKNNGAERFAKMGCD